ncbi:unnamed protein product [Rhizophagus irregularis]|uniref:DUF6973 domain-containing protein n=3 Tax=Rhizophagus irregularis TaxID=588596 RepID=A0A916EJU6_9GLOM|nr:hypothetical protein GLOIN_2v1706739 [Rhizophagus irregularis DAOM 181602=DAOM 197198]POG61113.1 hypothetical protein GLOIN_2v1706739 [Rhizophagus irregularis DAOM 181602=DAOM 197198]GBC32422.1 hypothetical protein GLOIN_2v1706739 [Rhizophagus irregularis DAOM 181602=DAOM 197198]CAB5388762.1 unnamed protein product [Rhizophagus irregularis]|eukprot:XP_025167979.1 hypothetical protein GLOIN_2v1706739 [Rhizophagus irregularis DAOM 181602=DAOM 197198]
MMTWIYQTILIIVILQNVITNILSIPVEPKTSIHRLETRYYFDYSIGGNQAEKDYCISILHLTRALDCDKARDLAEEALAKAKNNFPESTLHNGSGDAYRHCYWSGLLTFEFGVSGAKGFGDRHEDYPKNPSGEKAMDLNNNNVGRTVASQIKKGDKNALSAACKQALTDGRLKTLN